MRMPIYYTTSASCRPNNAIVIGGVNTAAKRRIQRKALHSCRREMPSPPPAPAITLEDDCASKCCRPDCKTKWPNCADSCCKSYLRDANECKLCTEIVQCVPTPAPKLFACINGNCIEHSMGGLPLDLCAEGCGVADPSNTCYSECCKPDCAINWPNCKGSCCEGFLKTHDQCASCTESAKCTPAPAPSPSICGTICTSNTDCSMSTKCTSCTQQADSDVTICAPVFTYKDTHNCYTRELWSDDKKDWCCQNMGLGCPTNNAS